MTRALTKHQNPVCLPRSIRRWPLWPLGLLRSHAYPILGLLGSGLPPFVARKKRSRQKASSPVHSVHWIGILVFTSGGVRKPRSSIPASFLGVRIVLRGQGINASLLVVGDPLRRGRFDQNPHPPTELTDRLSKPPAARTWPVTAQGGLNISRFEEHAGQLYVLPTPVVMNPPSAPVLIRADPVVHIFPGNLELDIEFQPGDFQCGG